MKKVMVFGTFDILHPGHVHMLKEAKAYGDFLVAIISRDSTVEQYKKRIPLHNEQERRQHVEALGIADKVRLGYEGDKYKVLEEEKPDVVALGYDQLFFVDQLENHLEDHVQIVRITPFMPDVYKSSLLPIDYKLTYEEDFDSDHEPGKV